MAFEVIEIPLTTVSGPHSEGDVFFNLTSFQIPARACKLVNMVMQVKRASSSSNEDIDDTKLGILFFQKNGTDTLGTLDDVADITSANFTANKYIGQKFLLMDSGQSSIDLDAIDEIFFYHQCGVWSQVTSNDDYGIPADMILKGDAGNTVLYCAGVVHEGDLDGSGDPEAPNFLGTDNVKLILHVEY
tara:strand:- start:3148 stop:3711 length:564 start_codon:yes stop_codon:yes gene_type:complete